MSREQMSIVKSPSICQFREGSNAICPGMFCDMARLGKAAEAWVKEGRGSREEFFARYIKPTTEVSQHPIADGNTIALRCEAPYSEEKNVGRVYGTITVTNKGEK